VWLKITKHLGPAFFINRSRSRSRNSKRHLSQNTCKLARTPTLIKKKKFDGHEICFKGKKNSWKEKRRDGFLCLRYNSFNRDKGVGVRERTFKVSFFFPPKENLYWNLYFFIFFSPKVGLLKSAEYASPDSNELGVIVHVVVVHKNSTRHFDPVKVFTYTTTLFTLSFFFLWSLNHVVKKKLQEKRNEYLSHYSQF